MKMLKIKEDIQKEFTAILGELTSRNGEIKTHDDVLKERYGLGPFLSEDS